MDAAKSAKLSMRRVVQTVHVGEIYFTLRSRGDSGSILNAK